MLLVLGLITLIYANKAKEELLKFLTNFDEVQVEIKIITKGDEVQDKRLFEIGERTFF